MKKKHKFLKNVHETTLGDHQTRTALVCDWHTDTGRPASYLAMNKKSDRLQVEMSRKDSNANSKVPLTSTMLIQ